MPKLFFIRHCKSEANSKNILAGQIDYPLSEKGFIDAKHIAANFTKEFHINRIISSPLLRTLQTAASFSDIFKIKIETDNRLIEQHVGSFSGKTFDELKDNPDYQWDKTKRWDWVPIGGGESYKMVAERVKPFLSDMGFLDKKEKILVVTHAVAMRLIKGHLENTLPLYPEALPGNGEIWEVDYEGLGRKYSLISHYYMNDINQ